MDMSETPSSHCGISGSTLKLIAIVAMAMDHTAWCLIDPKLTACGLSGYPQLVPLAALQELSALYVLSYLIHAIGRITFPLMLFFLTEGITHTRSIRRYAAGVLLFAFVSEIPFDLAFSGVVWDASGQNVFFTLFFSLLAMYAIRNLRHCPGLAVLAVTLCGGACWLLQSDYSCRGVIIACTMELLHEQKTQAYGVGCLVAIVLNPCECTALLALPAVRAYNGKRGWKLKYAFYLFYPAHLLLLYGIRRWIGNI